MPKTFSKRSSTSRQTPYPLTLGEGGSEVTASAAGIRSPASGSSPKAMRSLRVSSIPSAVRVNDFRRYLENLTYHCDGTGTSDTNVLAMSLAPDGRWKVATVCFHNEPEPFSECDPSTNVTVYFDHVGTRHELTVDCDFFGMTPLYCSPEQPVVE